MNDRGQPDATQSRGSAPTDGLSFQKEKVHLKFRKPADTTLIKSTHRCPAGRTGDGFQEPPRRPQSVDPLAPYIKGCSI